MKKNWHFAFKILALNFLLLVLLVSCAKKNSSQNSSQSLYENLQNIPTLEKKHSWFYFSEYGFEQIDLPQNAPQVLEKAWTESIRISSAANLVHNKQNSSYDAFALVNRLGMIAFDGENAKLFTDNSIFLQDTASSIVFSDEIPLFYLYRSSFFNDSAFNQDKILQSSRPFLVEFNPESKIFYPLVSYENLNLSETDQITDFFWDGNTWTCSAKKQISNGVEFSYFKWQPLVELTDLNPALSSNYFSFSTITEDEFKKINMPKLFSESPQELKEILKFIPQDLTFYVSWRNLSGTSETHYFQQGKSNFPLNANAAIIPLSNYIAAIFEDGTSYIKQIGKDKILAFRLPRLPENFSYGEFVISKNVLYVSWEETNFYKTSRSGFISVDLGNFEF